MKDNRITILATADAFAQYKKHRPLYWIRNYKALAIYIFGKRIYRNGDWKK